VAAPAPKTGTRPAAVIDPESIPAWQKAATETLEAAARDGHALIIYFQGEGDTDASFVDKELAEISKAEAVFIRIAFTEDREKSPWAEESVIPTSKILSDNPSRDYGIAVGKMTVVIADSYGNEYTRINKQPKADEVKGYLKKVKENADKTSEKLRKNLDKANEALAASDRKGALKLLLKNFGEGIVGLTAQEDSIRAYHDILDAGRGELAELTEKKDGAGLKALGKEFDKTDLDKEIDEAIKALK
jgi:hypothetical protein